MFKAKPSGQAGSARRSATVFAVYRDVRFNLDSHIVAVAQKKSLHFLAAYRTPVLAQSRIRENVSTVVDAYHVFSFCIGSWRSRFNLGERFVFGAGFVNESDLSARPNRAG